MGTWLSRTLHAAYRDLDVGKTQIFLVDRCHAVLSAFSQKAQTYAAKMLEQRGVQLRLGTSVKEVALAT